MTPASACPEVRWISRASIGAAATAFLAALVIDAIIELPGVPPGLTMLASVQRMVASDSAAGVVGVLASIAIPLAIALCIAGAIMRAVVVPSRGSQVLAVIAIAALVGTIAASITSITLILDVRSMVWTRSWTNCPDEVGVLAVAAASGAVVLAWSHRAVARGATATLPRSVTRIGWTMAAVGTAVLIVVFAASRTPASGFEFMRWEQLWPTLRLLAGTAALSAAVAVLARIAARRARAPAAGGDSDVPAGNLGWSYADTMAVTACLLAFAITGVSGRYWIEGDALNSFDRIVVEGRTIYYRTITVATTTAVLATLCGRAVLLPTMTRLRGRGRLVNAWTLLTLATLVAVPGVGVLVYGVSDDYRTLIPLRYEPLVWALLLVAVAVPAVAAFLVAVVRAVAPHDSGRLVRFLWIASGVVIGLAIGFTVMNRLNAAAPRDPRVTLGVLVASASVGPLLATTWSQSWMARPLRAWRRRSCVGCGYPRRTPMGDLCPECGRPWTKRRAGRLRSQHEPIQGRPTGLEAPSSLWVQAPRENELPGNDSRATDGA